MQFIDYKLFSGSLNDLPASRKSIINTINQYSFCIAEKDPVFKKSLIHADILLPDGVGIVAAVKYLSDQNIKKVAGADLFQHLMLNLNAKGGKCFFLGSSEETLEKIAQRLTLEFQAVNAEYYSPPFTSTFSEEDNKKMIQAVNAFKPEVLFIGMTAPKQEKWAFEHKDQLDAQKICAIGAVFDFYAGTVDRPRPLWIKLGLEWFIRLFKEPKRMWRRYIYYGPVFLYHIYKEKSNRKKRKAASY